MDINIFFLMAYNTRISVWLASGCLRGKNGDQRHWPRPSPRSAHLLGCSESEYECHWRALLRYLSIFPVGINVCRFSRFEQNLAALQPLCKITAKMAQVNLHEKQADRMYFGTTCGFPAAADNFTCQHRHIYLQFRI